MGLVTLEDILEEIVGDIKDEHDIAVQGVRPQPDGSVNVDGSVPIRDLNRAMDWNLPDEEATTIAGLVIHEAQSIPDAGQIFTFHGFRFQVLRKIRNRITRLRITPLTQVRAGRSEGYVLRIDRTFIPDVITGLVPVIPMRMAPPFPIGMAGMIASHGHDAGCHPRRPKAGKGIH